MTSLDDLIAAFLQRMRRTILPFWASQGFDSDAALFGERTDLNGRLVRDVPHRAMVQARQIYVYSDAERTGENPGHGARAIQSLDNLLARFSDENDLQQGLAFSVSVNGAIISFDRDAYTHAFVLFALASAFRLTQDKRLLRAIEGLVKFIDEHLTDNQAGGLFNRYPSPEIFKRQNPTMHMLEAYLALHEALPSGQFLDRAAAVVRLFRERLFQSDLGVIFEIYGVNWSPEGRTPDLYFEPGHQFEWAWLLHKCDMLSGSDHSYFCDMLWETACRNQPTFPFLCPDEVAIDPTLSKRTSRLWPHTEGIRAAICQYERGNPDAEIVLERQLRTLHTFFLDRPFAAGWTDRVDARGQPISDMVPASTLYHLYTALTELSRVSEERSKRAASMRS
jgi:mannose/cellobiose epimerase-like protein (N-acyl-D-glucosamine 2-epimerase family)